MNKQILFLAFLTIIFTPSLHSAELTEAEKKTETALVTTTPAINNGELEVDLFLVPNAPEALESLKRNCRNEHKRIARCFGDDVAEDRCFQVDFFLPGYNYLGDIKRVAGFPNPMITMPRYIPRYLIPNEGNVLKFTCPILSSKGDMIAAKVGLREKLEELATLTHMPPPLTRIIAEYGCSFDQSVLIKATARNLDHTCGHYGKTEDAITEIVRRAALCKRSFDTISE